MAKQKEPKGPANRTQPRTPPPADNSPSPDLATSSAPSSLDRSEPSAPVLPARTGDNAPELPIGAPVYYIERDRYVMLASRKLPIDPSAAIVSRIYRDKEGIRTGKLGLTVFDFEAGVLRKTDVPYSATIAPEAWTPMPVAGPEIPFGVLGELIAAAVDDAMEAAAKKRHPEPEQEQPEV